MAESKAKVALITGITGQDGSYLTELLLEKGYIVHGIIRRASSFNTTRIEHLYKDSHAREARLFLHYGDLIDASNLVHLMTTIKPDEVYNLAAQSHVQVSFEMPDYTANVDALGTLRLLEAIRTAGLTKTVRFYQASTSELYGKVEETEKESKDGKKELVYQTETTPFHPRSPYAVAKLFAYWATINYREAYGMHASNGILFNHESPRRGPTFVTRKTTRAVAKIHHQLKEGKSPSCLYLGNLEAQRDWGHAKDYVHAMWLMLQAKDPSDYVVATGETHKIREFVEKAFAVIGLNIKWQGTGIDEVGVDQYDRILVRIDARYFRPAEVDFLLGSPAKAKDKLGWTPTVKFEDLVKEMVLADIKHPQN